MQTTANAASKNDRSPWLSIVGPCASVLCLIHCFGTAVLALAAPGLLKVMPHSWLFETSVWFIAAASGLFGLRRVHSKPGVYFLFLAMASLGLMGVVLHSHRALHGSLITMAVIQLVQLLRKHYLSEQKPDCCEKVH